MKVIHLPFCFYPDPVGGTEVYVESLARESKKIGIESVIAAPAETGSSYSHNGLVVYRYRLSPNFRDLSDLYREGDEDSAREFGHLLDQEHPDIVHFHALTRGVSLLAMRKAKQRKIPVVFTYHTPTVSCQRGILMRWGKEICDGVLRLHTCSRCTLHGLGMPRGLAELTGSIPAGFGKSLSQAGLSGKIVTAFQMTYFVDLRHDVFHRFVSEVDHIIAVANWANEVLVRNGVPPEKITVMHHGLCREIPSRVSGPEIPVPQGKLKMAFLGRMDPTKGLHVLLKAVKSVPGLDVSLDIYGIAQDPSGKRYKENMQKLAGNDPRIHFRKELADETVISCLRHYDLLAVPSQWMETGPLVVLEAFAAGIPVVGSNLGGIPDLIQHEINGLLVPFDSTDAWALTFSRLVSEPALLSKLKAGIHAPRGMDIVAKETAVLYETLLGRA